MQSFGTEEYINAQCKARYSQSVSPIQARDYEATLGLVATLREADNAQILQGSGVVGVGYSPGSSPEAPGKIVTRYPY